MTYHIIALNVRIIGIITWISLSTAKFILLNWTSPWKKEGNNQNRNATWNSRNLKQSEITTTWATNKSGSLHCLAHQTHQQGHCLASQLYWIPGKCIWNFYPFITNTCRNGNMYIHWYIRSSYIKNLIISWWKIMWL